MFDDGDFDIFHWANQMDAIKNKLDIELFLFNKNYTPYAVPIGSGLEHKLRALFLYDYIHAIELGAGTGLSVRHYSSGNIDDNILPRIELDDISRASTLIYLVGEGRSEVAEFSHEEHDVKRMHGIVARFTDPKNPGMAFYTVKQLQRPQVLTKASAWQLGDGRLTELEADTAFKIAPENQVLVVGRWIYAFNHSKFLSLFKQDPLTDEVVRRVSGRLTQQYKLALPEGLSMEYLADHNQSLAKALIKLDTDTLPSLDDVVQHADETGLALMTDNSGGIIIMDNRDAMMLVNILADNYVDSGLTGAHYLATSKKRIDTDTQLNMNL